MSEALAIEFANTRFMYRGEPRDLLASVKSARVWLHDHGFPSTPFRSGDVEELARMRDAIRASLEETAAGRPLPPAHLDLLNAASRLGPIWPELVHEDGAPAIAERSGASATHRVAAAIARSAIHLIGDDHPERVRKCEAPGCVLFFEPDARRRVWCSPACGNRARVARHYRRHRAD